MLYFMLLRKRWWLFQSVVSCTRTQYVTTSLLFAENTRMLIQAQILPEFLKIDIVTKRIILKYQVIVLGLILMLFFNGWGWSHTLVQILNIYPQKTLILSPNFIDKVCLNLLYLRIIRWILRSKLETTFTWVVLLGNWPLLPDEASV